MNELQTHLDQLRTGKAPIPLTNPQAAAQAVRLRSRGMTYTQISIVMGIYHDQWYTKSHWRLACRTRGAPPVNRGYGRTQACRS